MRPSGEPSEFRIWGLALGYFGFYIPYSGLTKALTQGSLPGADGPVTGFTILPATAIGTTALLLVLLAVGRTRGQASLKLPAVRWPTLISGVATAVIIGTTTLNYTSAGLSILFALLLMRGGVLTLAPFIDLATGRRVSPLSWVALVLSLTAVGVAFSAVGSYHLTLIAAMNIFGYLAGYAIRLNVMSRVAKDRDPDVNRKHFEAETFVAAVALVALPALMAIALPGPIGGELRVGFSGLFTSRYSGPALVIGLLYGILYMFGTWIYLDSRENTFCIPLNRCASLLSGVVASYAIAILFGGKLPGIHELAGVSIICVAIGALVIETLIRHRPGHLAPVQRIFLFVCGGNTSRSPMAQAICNAEIARRIGRASGSMVALSAGLTASPGRPLTGPSIAALHRIGVPPHDHASREVDAGLVGRAEMIFCMTEAQRRDLVERFPEAGPKARRLDQEADIDDPSGRSDDAYHALADRLAQLIGSALPALGV
jgi:protein-tyrosine-phosphatase